MAWARMVAVVVPSPALSLVLEATSRIIWAPRFSNLSLSSISLATVTPSLVERGAPKDFSMTTLRPLGPRVTLTALARMLTPRSMRSRASVEKYTSLAAMVSALSFRLGCSGTGGSRRASDQDAQDVAFLHDQQIFAFQLDLAAGPLAEQDAVAFLQVERMDLAILIAGAGADGEDFAFLRLFLRGVGDDDAPLGLLFFLDAADEDAVAKRTKRHGCFLRRCVTG